MSIFTREALRPIVEQVVHDELAKLPTNVNQIRVAIVGYRELVELRVATRIITEKGVVWEIGGVVGYSRRDRAAEAAGVVIITWGGKS